jgi:hypothetical protein
MLEGVTTEACYTTVALVIASADTAIPTTFHLDDDRNPGHCFQMSFYLFFRQEFAK